MECSAFITGFKDSYVGALRCCCEPVCAIYSSLKPTYITADILNEENLTLLDQLGKEIQSM